ncbi:hypothetical protein [uncultured Variovorax sp.]|uniref:hypothetical protein n=1 Tax=uncultured Variovorax sp. TaxID=114708 RepID=UPI0025E785B2|nr:hypothetical protein [uncultured Variovorax sp.]
MDQKPARNELQKTFIAMIFAFAVSAVALQLAEFFIVVTGNWTLHAKGNQGFNSQELLNLGAILSHLAVALIMITASWVMWSKSQAAGHLAAVESIVSLKFFLVLIEVVLVTLYFSISKSAEGSFTKYTATQNFQDYLTTPSASPEAVQILLVFILFLLWDFVADVAMSPLNPNPASRFKRVLNWVPGTFVYGFVSVACALLTLPILYLSSGSVVPGAAISGDFALILLVILFYQLKAIEPYLLRLAKTQATRANTPRDPKPIHWIQIIFLFFGYAAALTCLWSLR